MLALGASDSGFESQCPDMLLATHDGKFHLDEMFAIATLLMVFPDLEIKRTRDDQIIAHADIVVDVGGVYDVKRKRFDHHQSGGAGKRENGVPYASFGLVWKEFGQKVCNGDERVASLMDKKLAQPIDASDSGYVLFKTTNREVSPYLFENVVRALTPTWKDTESIDNIFFDILPFIKMILEKEIQKAHYFFEDTQAVKETYKNSEHREIIVLEHSYPWRSILARKKEPIYVIHPDQNTGNWIIACVPVSSRATDCRKLFPDTWRGKKDDDLKNITGVGDAVFCHDKGFIAVATTREGAIEMAKQAIAF